jgi:hypothetical protein
MLSSEKLRFETSFPGSHLLVGQRQRNGVPACAGTTMLTLIHVKSKLNGPRTGESA